VEFLLVAAIGFAIYLAHVEREGPPTHLDRGHDRRFGQYAHPAEPQSLQNRVDGARPGHAQMAMIR
jgi:hypothetical protein